MPNIASILKAEIVRIARKEVRTEVDALKKSVAHQRTLIAGLRRQVDALEKAHRRLARQQTRSEAAAPSDAPEPKRRFSAPRLAAHREKLGLSADLYGRLAGVSGQTIYNWEQGKSRPRETQLRALAEVRSLGKREVMQHLTEG